MAAKRNAKKTINKKQTESKKSKKQSTPEISVIIASFNEEKNIWHKGYERVVGLDEAGRGPLAGPVVASAVMVRQFKISNLKFKINDSKKISAKNREKIYEILINHPDIRWGIGIVSEKVIDKINILEATKLAMQKAIINLQNKFSPNSNCRDKEGKGLDVNFLLIDGNFGLQAKIPQKSIIKGDFYTCK